MTRAAPRRTRELRQTTQRAPPVPAHQAPAGRAPQWKTPSRSPIPGSMDAARNGEVRYSYSLPAFHAFSRHRSAASNVRMIAESGAKLSPPARIQRRGHVGCHLEEFQEVSVRACRLISRTPCRQKVEML